MVRKGIFVANTLSVPFLCKLKEYYEKIMKHMLICIILP
uniref:Uncharacterized protein n=1 Tax=Salix viminalis TaxID=40686 RepID=A0A6N2LZH6_SALVM